MIAVLLSVFDAAPEKKLRKFSPSFLISLRKKGTFKNAIVKSTAQILIRGTLLFLIIRYVYNPKVKNGNNIKSVVCS